MIFHAKVDKGGISYFKGSKQFENSGRGSPKDQLCQNYFQIGSVIFDKKIFTFFSFGCDGKQNSAWNNFERGPPNHHSC